MESKNPDNESLRKQLSELNSRVRNHIQALWQISLAYLGLIALVFGFGEFSPLMLLFILFILFIIGCLVIWAMYGWREGAARGVLNIQEVEKKLDLELTAETHFYSHELPHFLLVVFGMGAIGIVFVYMILVA